MKDDCLLSSMHRFVVVPTTSFMLLAVDLVIQIKGDPFFVLLSVSAKRTVYIPNNTFLPWRKQKSSSGEVVRWPGLLTGPPAISAAQTRRVRQSMRLTARTVKVITLQFQLYPELKPSPMARTMRAPPETSYQKGRGWSGDGQNLVTHGYEVTPRG